MTTSSFSGQNPGPQTSPGGQNGGAVEAVAGVTAMATNQGLTRHHTLSTLHGFLLKPCGPRHGSSLDSTDEDGRQEKISNLPKNPQA